VSRSEGGDRFALQDGVCSGRGRLRCDYRCRHVAERRPDQQERHHERRHIEGDHGNPRSLAKQRLDLVGVPDAWVNRSHGADLLTSGAIRKHVVGTLLRVRRQRTRWEEDNVASLNVAALVVVGAIVLGIAGLVLAVALT
jgi:hypothetical protein